MYYRVVFLDGALQGKEFTVKLPEFLFVDKVVVYGSTRIKILQKLS